MKIIVFIEARRRDIIRKILERCGLWQGPCPAAWPGKVIWEIPIKERHDGD